MEIRLLGPLEVRAEGQVVPLPAGKPRALLALLLLEAGRVVPVERLVDGLWGERPPASAAKLVQGYVSRVRRALGAEFVLTRAPGYLVPLEQADTDLRRFYSLLLHAREAAAAQASALLGEALALWRGPPLAELADSAFAQPEIARLEELRLAAVEEQMEADLALGKHERLVPELERLLAREPLRERLRGQLMLALYRSGRQAEALETFRAGRRLMVDELGLEPGRELHELERRILEQDPGLAADNGRVLPQGTITFLFAEGPSEHRHLMREALTRHGGVEVEARGDSFLYAFARAADALAAAEAAQRHACARIGVHSGEPVLTSEGYVGVDVHRAARIAAVGHGGQTLVSRATRELVPDAELRDLGDHRLKDLARAERIYQLGGAEFPPLDSLYRTNLPVAAGPLLGRERELAEIARLVGGGTRLVTLTGAGGSGKTRLALQAAAELIDTFPDGVFFAGLAPLNDAALVHGAVAQALEVDLEQLDDVLASRRMLLVVDNAEHLPGVERVVGELLAGSVVLLVTSRVPLHLAAEHELAVEPLENVAAAELFVAHAAAVGRPLAPDETVRAVCRRLDNLPLAVELAAARAKLLSPAAILERLDRALPLLTGGARDAPQRQQTLSATIDWSYQLLSDESRTVFRRLAVFRSGFTLGAAEEVAGGDLDAVAALVDHSLLKPVGDDRFLMLETLREYALERLVEGAEFDELRLRHGRYYLERFEEIAPILLGPRMLEFLDWYEDEAANTWAALDELFAAGEHELALRLAVELGPYWISRGRIRDGHAWLSGALAAVPQRSSAFARALALAGDLALRSGDLAESRRANDEALCLATELGELRTQLVALRYLAKIHHFQSDDDGAITLVQRARELAHELADTDQFAVLGSELAVFLIARGRLDEAERHVTESLASFRETGDESHAAIAETVLVSLEQRRGRFDRAGEHGERALEAFRRFGSEQWASETLSDLALTALATDRRGAAFAYAHEAIELALGIGDPPTLAYGVELLALSVAEEDPLAAARLWGATSRFRRERGARHEVYVDEQVAPRLALIEAGIGDAAFERELRAGEALSLDDAGALAFALPAPVERAAG